MPETTTAASPALTDGRVSLVPVPATEPNAPPRATETHRFTVHVTAPDGTERATGVLGLERTPASVVADVSFEVDPDILARGSASTGLRLLVDHAFGKLGVRTLRWTAPAGDIDGWRLAWHNGFTFEGSTRGTLDLGGAAVDAWQATLLSSDGREPKTSWITPVRLTAPGVVLRPVALADEARFLETMDDPVTMLWLGTIPLPRTSEAFRSLVRDGAINGTLGQHVSWTVAQPGTDAYLATISLFGIDDLDYLSGEVGYRTHPDARGRGVLTSGLRTVVRFAFTPVDEGGVGLERLSLLAGEGNDASLGVARSLGFTEVGRDRQCYDLDDGRVVDLVRFDLLRAEFEA